MIRTTKTTVTIPFFFRVVCEKPDLVGILTALGVVSPE